MAATANQSIFPLLDYCVAFFWESANRVSPQSVPLQSFSLTYKNFSPSLQYGGKAVCSLHNWYYVHQDLSGLGLGCWNVTGLINFGTNSLVTLPSLW